MLDIPAVIVCARVLCGFDVYPLLLQGELGQQLPGNYEPLHL